MVQQRSEDPSKCGEECDGITSPYYLALTKHRHMFVSDGVTQKILKYDLDGHLVASWGTFGAFAGGLWSLYLLNVDSEGNLYVAEVFNGRAQKFRPKAGADPAMLIRETTHGLWRDERRLVGVAIGRKSLPGVIHVTHRDWPVLGLTERWRSAREAIRAAGGNVRFPEKRELVLSIRSGPSTVEECLCIVCALAREA